MKTITHVVLITALGLPMAVNPLAGQAQQPRTRYVFRTVAQPGAIIGGRTFTRDTVIGSTALNDTAEIAFVAKDPAPQQVAIFTSRRLVAKEGDVVGGKYIVLIPPDAILAINNAGQVAYEAWYADTWERASVMDYSGRGIFVDDHLATDTAFDSHGNALPFIFTDDGRIVFEHQGPTSPAPKSTPARLRLKLPRESVNITAGENRPAERKPSSPAHPLLAPFPVNHRGQILVPVNFEHEGFLLLLGTPSIH